MVRLPHHAGRRALATLLLATAVAISSSNASTQAASSESTVVAAYVPSATNLSTAGCATGQANRTDFGTLLAGTSTVTSLSCTIQFGSSNDTARLLLRQSDGRGVGMYQNTRGALDPSFGTAGTATTAVGPGANSDMALASAVQSDGKLVAVGNCDMGGASTGTDACLVRYQTNGTLDPSFDFDGRVTIAIGPSNYYDSARAVGIQTDGKIVVAGSCGMGGGATGNDMCAARVNTDGSLDSTFDVDGRVTVAISSGSRDDVAHAMTIQSDGKIVMAGYCDIGGATGLDGCLARLNTNGSLDTSFDGDGRLTTAIAPAASSDNFRSVTTQPDGKIVIVGSCDMGGATGKDMCLARYETNGALDVSFDTDGIQTVAIAPGVADDAGMAIALQPDGKLVVAGNCTMGVDVDVCAARLTAGGSLDATFDVDGKVSTPVSVAAGIDRVFAVRLGEDGSITTGGECHMAGVTDIDLCLVRYTTSGALDTTFDGDGIVTTAVAPGTGTDTGRSVVLQHDGTIMVAGGCSMGGATGSDLCVAQYRSAGSLSQYVDATTDWDTVGTGHFGACMTGVTSGTASWTTSATCPMTDGAYWNAIPTTATQIATATANTTNATANLRFGIRVAANQTPGSYIAPITFDLIAP